MLRLQPPVQQLELIIQTIDRRNFIRHSALFVAGTSVLGMFGCSEDAEPIDDGEEPGGEEPGGEEPGGEEPGGEEPGGEEPGGEEPGGEVPQAPDGGEVEMDNNLKKVGGTQLVSNQAILNKLDSDNGHGRNDPVLLVRVDDETVAANTVICTHQQCNVAFNAGSQQLLCPCHQSRYDLDGNLIQGAIGGQRDLLHFKATIFEDSVYLVKA